MGLEKQSQKRQFSQKDLGILDGPPSRGIRTIVELCALATRARSTALFIFDDAASELFLSASDGLARTGNTPVGLPLTGSVASHVRLENQITRINELGEAPFDTSVEYARFGIRAYMGAIVRGPADEALGILAVMHQTPHFWTFHEAKMLEDMAYLLSQQILLKASFETLRLMSAERKDAQN